jgi:hypothetical protein
MDVENEGDQPVDEDDIPFQEAESESEAEILTNDNVSLVDVIKHELQELRETK